VTDVVIVGGGIAGLATAYEVARAGLSFVVLERAKRPGGVILSEEIDGFTIDGGPDALLIQKPDGIKLCQEIGLGERLVTTKLPRLAYIQRGGRLHPLPAGSVLGIPTEWGPFIRTSLFSWPGKIRMGAELFVAPRRDAADESIGGFIERRFGREAKEYLAEPLLAGIHAGDVDRLSMKALFPRFLDAERKYGSLLKAFRAMPRPPSSEGAFKSLPGGLSEMVRALVNVIGASQIRIDTTVVRVRRDAGQLSSASAAVQPYAVETTRGETLRCRALVLATPAWATAALVNDLDPELAGLCASIPYASAATVALAFKRSQVAHPLNGSGYVVPRVENVGILAGSWLSSKWPNRAPDDEHVLLRTFFGGARDPHALERSDAELVRHSLAALGPVLGISGEPLLTRIYRWDRANAQHEVGHLERIAAIDRRLADHAGLFVTGSGFRAIGIPDCIADGRETAARAAGYVQGSVVH